jgi:hypothetical protein
VRRAEGRRRKILADIVLSGLELVFCTISWLGISAPAQIAGGIWFIIGVFVLAAHTRGFRQPMVLPYPGHYE